MDPQTFVDRILENESLTGDLEDGPASQLLHWGTGLVPTLVQELEDEEAAGDKISALMALMRQVNRMAGNSAGAAADELAPALGELVERHAQVFGQALEVNARDLEAAATSLAALSPGQAVPFLIAWLNPKKS